MMNEPVELNGLMDNPAARRLWLLHNALRSLPFDRAIELARAAEAFVTGSAFENRADDIRIDAAAPAAPGREPTEPLITEISGKLCGVEQPRTKKSTRLALPTERRDQLLDRLAEDANNAELSAEFGITSKQVQGIRMGCARDIVERRARLSTQPAEPEQPPAATGSIDEISPAATTSIDSVVRFLRQQDDVVVPQRDGEYLINGRFRMSAAELIASDEASSGRRGSTRARIRTRRRRRGLWSCAARRARRDRGRSAASARGG